VQLINHFLALEIITKFAKWAEIFYTAIFWVVEKIYRFHKIFCGLCVVRERRKGKKLTLLTFLCMVCCV
jgi:hypothetical protein